MNVNSFNLTGVDEPGVAGAVKRKWRERLRSRGIRLVLAPVLNGPRRKESKWAYDLGANSYLVKPGDFQTLVDHVNLLASYWLAVNEKSDLEGEGEGGPNDALRPNPTRIDNHGRPSEDPDRG